MPVRPPIPLRLAITMGDPCGIGPEVAVKALPALLGRRDRPRIILVGDPNVWRQAARRYGGKRVCRLIADAPEIKFPPAPASAADAPLALYAVARLDASSLRPGRPGQKTGRAMRQSIEAGASLCLSGQADALLTAPITKAAMLAGGSPHGGHTELLAELCGAKDPVMMLMNDRLRVILITTHLPLAEAARCLSRAGLLRLLRAAAAGLRQDFGIKRPRLWVAGLNPHAGEGGALGQEEEKVILPALAHARAAGISVEGPLAPDTLFVRALSAKPDAVVCMYHDQGLIPLKLLDFLGTVNVTLGLPLVRTSPGHGSAHDIAGRGVASAEAMVRAGETALAIARRRAAGRRGHGGR